MSDTEDVGVFLGLVKSENRRASTLPQKERPRPPHLAHLAKLRIAVVIWIERTYHRRRRQIRLGRLTPVEYETVMAPPIHPLRKSRLTCPTGQVPVPVAI